MTWPDTTRSKLAAWAGNQGADGMLAEQILNKAPDQPQGRVMSDSTSMFILYVLELLRWAGDTETLRLYYPTVKRAAQWQMLKSKELGVPKGLETTYDILRFPQYDVSTYASVFHLAAMRAGEELATRAGDAAFAAQCAAAFSRAQQQLDALQWNEAAGLYDAVGSGCNATGCATRVGVFADAFYGQVLAYTLGLGDLLAHPERLDTHLANAWTANCVHNNASGAVVPGCPNGLVIMTGRITPPRLGGAGTLTDLQVWEMATYDHVALLLHRGKVDPAAAITLAEGTGTSYSQRVNDQWNIAGIKMNDGMPSITSHYGYHMTSWHTVFALSGQAADLSDPKGATLSFSPRVPCARKGDGYAYPFLLPGVVGSVDCEVTPSGRHHTLSVYAGTLRVDRLNIGGDACPHVPVNASAGDVVMWTASS